MKLCTKCNEEKDATVFSSNAKSKDGLFAWCKPCMATYERERYQNGDRARKERNKKAVEQKARQYIWDYLCSHACIDCGNDDARVLEFDHRDGVEKKFNISEMVHNAVATVQLEIDKCDVRCANCHRLRTIVQLGFWRGTMIQERPLGKLG